MSTRGGVGYVVGDDGIRYVYQHFDSYPEGLAKSLLREYRRLDGDLARMRKEAVDDHSGGWSVYPERCYCHDPERGDEADMTSTCRCSVGDYDSCDPLFIEWLYVLNARGLDVYKSVPAGSTVERIGYQGQPYTLAGYKHVFVGTLPWDATEVDVCELEERAHALYEAAGR